MHKDQDKQRLIFDGRAVNKVFKKPDKPELPSFSLLQSWELREGEVAKFGKIDLDHLYHRLKIPL